MKQATLGYNNLSFISLWLSGHSHRWPRWFPVGSKFFFGVRDSKDKTNGHDDRKRKPDKTPLKPAERESGVVKEDKAAAAVEPPTPQDAKECKDAMEIDERQNEIDEGWRSHNFLDIFIWTIA